MLTFISPSVMTAGLAIFSMLFGAGNLIFPLKVGVTSGQFTPLGMLFFLVTSVLLPVLGLLSMILFDGNYPAFFSRLGKHVGPALTALCMFIIGPGLVIPRTITLSHLMLAPFLPGIFSQINPLSSFLFALCFVAVTFICTYRESKIVDLLGHIISPLLLVALAIIIIKGIFSSATIVTVNTPVRRIIIENLLLGYETLDLLGTIFFSSIILVILKKQLAHLPESPDKQERLIIGLKSGLLGVALLALIYCGMGYLGAYFGHGLADLDAGQLFRTISCTILGERGSFIIAVAVLMACLSTAMGLAGVTADYLQRHIGENHVSYATCVGISLLLSLPLSTCGLSTVLAITGGPLTYIGYPVIIVLTCANIAYKLWGFKPIKTPVLLTAIAAAVSYYSQFLLTAIAAIAAAANHYLQ